MDGETGEVGVRGEGSIEFGNFGGEIFFGHTIESERARRDFASLLGHDEFSRVEAATKSFKFVLRNVY